ncbi:MAG: CoA pyrophosphatase [Proteobacteria bacterium]|nr:CoA pyrophosphatase [Pseudomonadota bacterium]
MKALDTLNFTAQTRDRLCSNVQSFTERRQDETNLRRAAVTLTVFKYEGGAAIILTRRSSKLRDHGGQWALPGGRIDPGENAVQAALRELNEEINLSLDESHVLGLLDDYLTRSGYLITPVVIWTDVEYSELEPNLDEVDSIHAFTFDELSRADSPYLESIPQSDRPVLSMHYGDDRIFAPTGALLYQFREVAIFGRATRVLHYDQPVFAWK